MWLRCFEKTPIETHTVALRGRHKHWPAQHLARVAHPALRKLQDLQLPSRGEQHSPPHSGADRAPQAHSWRVSVSGCQHLQPRDSCPGIPKATSGRDTVRTAGKPALWRQGWLYQFKEPEETWQACSYPSQPPRAALLSADQVITHSHDRLLQKSPGKWRSIVKLLFQPRALPTQRDLLTIPGAPNS